MYEAVRCPTWRFWAESDPDRRDTWLGMAESGRRPAPRGNLGSAMRPCSRTMADRGGRRISLGRLKVPVSLALQPLRSCDPGGSRVLPVKAGQQVVKLGYLVSHHIGNLEKASLTTARRIPTGCPGPVGSSRSLRRRRPVDEKSSWAVRTPSHRRRDVPWGGTLSSPAVGPCPALCANS